MTVLSGILTVIVCVSVFLFSPDIHERGCFWQPSSKKGKSAEGKSVATTANPKSGGGSVKRILNAQLKIALPEGISKSRCRN